MTVSSVKTGELSLSFALNNNFMEPIATTLVGSGGVGTITFSDIPQTYKHLQLRGIAQVTLSTDPGGSGGATVRFNNDQGANYTRHYLEGDGASVFSFGQANTNNGAVERFLYRQTNNNIYGAIVCDILDYSNSSKYKTVRNIGGFDTNATSGVVGDVYLNSFLWMNTNSISSITLGVGTESFKQYSRFSLYGIKG